MMNQSIVAKCREPMKRHMTQIWILWAIDHQRGVCIFVGPRKVKEIGGFTYQKQVKSKLYINCIFSTLAEMMVPIIYVYLRVDRQSTNAPNRVLAIKADRWIAN